MGHDYEKPSGLKAKRARRRLDRARMRKRAIAAYHFLAPERAARLADHMKSCSCYCCGNPRRHWAQVTMAERRAGERFLSFLEEEGGTDEFPG